MQEGRELKLFAFARQIILDARRLLFYSVGMEKLITLRQAVERMREVSRVTANALRQRDESGQFVNYPEIRRVQERKGKSPLSRGSAILVYECDVALWVASRKLPATRTFQVPPDDGFGHILMDVLELGRPDARFRLRRALV